MSQALSRYQGGHEPAWGRRICASEVLNVCSRKMRSHHLCPARPGGSWSELVLGLDGMVLRVTELPAGNRPAALGQLAQRTRLSGLQDALHSRYVSH